MVGPPAATRLGPHEIVCSLGAGSMGEVYRATDANLKWSVAIELLPASVAGDTDRNTPTTALVHPSYPSDGPR